MSPFAALRMRRPVTGGGGGSGTPPAFVGSTSATTSSATSITVSLTGLLNSVGGTATLLQNDFVLVAVEGGSASDLTFTEGGGTWTKECDLFSTDTNKCNFAVFSKFMGASPDTSITISGLGGSNNGTTVTVHAFRGVKVATPYDVTTVTATGANTGRPDPAAITPVTGGAVIYVAGGGSCGASTGAVFTNPGDLDTGTNSYVSAHRSSASDSTTVGAGFAQLSGSGAFDPAQWGGNLATNSLAWCALTMALRPADA
jgi:hypothetical protein